MRPVTSKVLLPDSNYVSALEGDYRLGSRWGGRARGIHWPAYVPRSLTWHCIRSYMKRDNLRGWCSCADGPLRRDGLGGHFTPCHSMFVYRANSVTRSAVPGGVGGGGKGAMSSTLLKHPHGTHPERHHSCSVGCNQPPAQPKMRDQAWCSKKPHLSGPSRHFSICARIQQHGEIGA